MALLSERVVGPGAVTNRRTSAGRGWDLGGLLIAVSGAVMWAGLRRFQALAHGRGDVAVDAADAAEAAGLDDLGDVVFDQPGFVGVAQVVEVHAGQDR